MYLNKKLQLIADQIEDNSFVLDIGTDHAKLPIYLVRKSDRNIRCDCSDKNINPLKIATQNINKANLFNEISLFHSDGFYNISNYNKYNVIVISGVGGKVIGNIINNRKLSSKLILSPRSSLHSLKKILRKNHYKVKKEILVEEKKNIFEIIYVAERVKLSFFISSKVYSKKLIKNNDKIILSRYLNQIYKHKVNIYNNSNKWAHKLEVKKIKKMLKIVENND